MFTLFARLPVELRIQIWEIALPSSAVLQIKENLMRKPLSFEQEPELETKNPHSESPYEDKIPLSSAIIQPSKLFANKESRQAALKFDLRASALASSSLEASLDFDVDTIYLQFNLGGKLDADDWLDDVMEQLETLARSEDFARVQKLAVLLQLDSTNKSLSQLSRVWRWFDCLEDFGVIVKHFDEGIGKEAVVVYSEPKRSLAEPMWGTNAPNIIVAMILVLSLELERLAR